MVSFLLFCLAWMIGIFVTAFGPIQILIILFFGIPMTLKLHQRKALISLKPLLHSLISIVLLSTLSLGAYVLTKTFLAEQMAGFYIGMGIAIFLGLGQLGGNNNNLSDYFTVNKKYIKSEYLDSGLQKEI